jgi:hypothetical protein
MVRSAALRAPINRILNRIAQEKLRRVVFSVVFFGSLQTFFALSQLRNASVMFGD